MGIKGGFATYMRDNWVAKLPHSPLKGKLVFDAMCVLNDLCQKIPSVWHYGGQYWELRKQSKKYFEGLISKGVEPIVVFDGVDCSRTEASFRNNKTELVKRYSSILLNGKEPNDRATVAIRPHFAKAVFCETLKEIEQVQFVFADGNADRAAVSIANRYKCPVVSADSDYFMFNIDGGYVPFDTFKYLAQEMTVTGKVYEFESFAKTFRNNEVMFLIPAILGNDAINCIYIPHDYNDGPIADCLVKFLQTCSSVKNAAIHYSCQLEDFSKNCDKAKQFYRITKQYSIEEYIEKKEVDVTTHKCDNISLEMFKNHRRGCLETSVMTTLAFSTCFLVIVDNPYKESAMNIGKPIRKSIYQILELQQVHEYIRKLNDKICKTTVNAATDAIDLTNPLCSVLNTSVKTLHQVADEWKLVALSLHFWTNKIECCNPHIIWSLVLCFVICSSCGDSNPQPLSCCADDAPTCNKLNTLHLFSMWQCVYYEAMKLNDILGRPFIFKSPAFLFDGKLAMHYACMDKDEFIKVKDRKLSTPTMKDLYVALIRTCVIKDAAKNKSKSATPIMEAAKTPIKLCNRFAALEQLSDSDN